MERIARLIEKNRRFFLFSLIKVLVLLMTLITNVLIANRLDVSAYGTYSLSMVLLGTLLTFGFHWSSVSIVYFGSKEKAEDNRLTKSFWSRVIIMGITWLLLTIIFIVFRNQINSYLNSDLAFIIYIWLFTAVSKDFVGRYYLAINQQILSNTIQFVSKFLFLLMVVFCDYDVRQLLLLDALANASLIFFVYKMKREDIGSFVFDEKVFREILRFSLWQIFSYSLIYLFSFADNYVIRVFMTTKDLAMYNVAFRLFNNLIGFSSVILNFYASMVMVAIARNDRDKIESFYYRQRFLIIALSTLGHIVLIVLSGFLINFLFTAKYNESVPVFNILMIGSVFRYAAIFYNIFLNSTGKYKELQYINICAIVLNLVLNYLLVERFGLAGVASATTITLMLMFVVSAMYTEPKIRRRIS